MEQLFITNLTIKCANKNTFVWKKAVTKNMEKRLDKLAEFVGECETLYGLKATYKNQVKMKHVKKLRKKLYALKKAEGIEFVHGKGKRKSPLQKSVETLEAKWVLEAVEKAKKEREICLNVQQKNDMMKSRRVGEENLPCSIIK